MTQAPPRELLAGFEGGPEPEPSRARAAEVLAAARASDAARLAELEASRGPELAAVLFGLCAVAPFFVPVLRRRPRLLLELAEGDLTQPRTREQLEARLAAALEGAPEPEVADRLRRFRRDELARISVREASDELVPLEREEEVLAELSLLAELVLAAALESAAREVEARLGPPVWHTAAAGQVSLRFAVLGLGKLGGGELNYASDVDLVYVYESPPPGSEPLREGPAGLAPGEYFARVARAFGKLVETITAEGFLYRIDLDLRPEGAAGALVVSSDALATYYDGWAAAWEKAAFMKARPVAGSLAFGWRVVRAIDPMIYQSSMDLAGVESIREMKARVEREHATPGSFDVKTGAGGIRDVEFVAQALQLLHGGRIPQVRGRSAPGALRALTEVGVLPPERCRELLQAYRFLRRVENRLQMEGERQSHRLPSSETGRERLARTLYRGEGALARFDAALADARHLVRAQFDALMQVGDAERVLELFARSATRQLAVPQTRPLLEDLAERFGAAVRESADPERAMNSLARFVEGVGGRAFYYQLLADRPELVPRLVGLFASSRTLSGVLATNPGLIEPIFSDPAELVPPRADMEQRLADLRTGLESGDRAPEEAALAALRLFQQRELVNVGLLDLAERLSLAEVGEALTTVAEVCVEEALRVAREQLRRGSPKAAGATEGAEFLVVGMGKLGSHELGYGSDLDVIFLFDVPGGGAAELLEAQEPHVKLAQKLGWALQTRTQEGVCYEVDARLRPSGNQGLLVTSLPSFERYHAESAMLWERQALLRARPVAGHAALAERFEALRRRILAAPLPDEVEPEIHRIRMRMENELAREVGGHRNLKTGRGGQLDVEAVVQLLQLRHGAAHPELWEARPIAELIAEVERLGLLAAGDCAVLREGWTFLQRLSSRLRIVENRSIADLEAQRADLDPVARSLGYPPSERSGTSRVPLLDDYARHTEAIRAVYDRVLGVGEEPPAAS